MKFLWLSWQSGCFCNQMTRAQIQPMAVFITNIYSLLTSFKRRKKEKLKNVTRWLDSVFNFWPFTTTKLCLMVNIILPKYAHVFARNLSQYCQSLFKISMTAPTYLPTYLPSFWRVPYGQMGEREQNLSKIDESVLNRMTDIRKLRDWSS